MRLLFSALFALAVISAAPADVTVHSLLHEMVNLTGLSKEPSPYYTTAQASSYDRKSKTPGNDDWFANGDAGQFLRTEQVSGHQEYVLADLTGPGAVVRFWSANPAGTVRFYFDGETTPRIVQKLGDLLTGKVAPMGDPFGYIASSGCNLYFPFPYAKSLKITVDDSDGNGARNLYYHVGYRTYDAGTPVTTLTMDQADPAEMARVADVLLHPEHRDLPAVKAFEQDVKVKPTEDKRIVLAADHPGAIYEFTAKVHLPVVKKGTAWTDPKQAHNILRQIILQLWFDDGRCVQAPIGDFFGTAPGINPMEQFPFSVKQDGTMTCRFVMPFAKSAFMVLTNYNQFPVQVAVKADLGPYQWDDRSYHFMTQWSGEDELNTRPMRDMSFLEVRGNGCWLGSNLQISNPVSDWWGEGDEKARVDGEAFPSTFGTGTEDYYGYAWGDPTPFVRPYHAEPRSGKTDGYPGSFGTISVNRWQIFDPIHFQKSLDFTLEEWHWAECDCTYVHTVYWYTRPGGTPPIPIPTALLLPREMAPPKPVAGALEGEAMGIVSKSGGVAEIQTGFWQTSGNAQLWWRNGAPGDKLVLHFKVAKAGRYKVSGNFCHARDYGIQKMTINGAPAGQIDFYEDGLDWKKSELGTFDLKPGVNTLEVEIAGSNDAANPKSYMFGLDYLLLDKG